MMIWHPATRTRPGYWSVGGKQSEMNVLALRDLPQHVQDIRILQKEGKDLVDSGKYMDKWSINNQGQFETENGILSLDQMLKQGLYQANYTLKCLSGDKNTSKVSYSANDKVEYTQDGSRTMIHGSDVSKAFDYCEDVSELSIMDLNGDGNATADELLAFQLWVESNGQTPGAYDKKNTVNETVVFDGNLSGREKAIAKQNIVNKFDSAESTEAAIKQCKSEVQDIYNMLNLEQVNKEFEKEMSA